MKLLKLGSLTALACSVGFLSTSTMLKKSNHVLPKSDWACSREKTHTQTEMIRVRSMNMNVPKLTMVADCVELRKR